MKCSFEFLCTRQSRAGGSDEKDMLCNNFVCKKFDCEGFRVEV